MALNYDKYRNTINEPHIGLLRLKFEQELERDFRGTIPELRKAEKEKEKRVGEEYTRLRKEFLTMEDGHKNLLFQDLCAEYGINPNVGLILFERAYQVNPSYPELHYIEAKFREDVEFYRRLMGAQQQYVQGKEISPFSTSS